MCGARRRNCIPESNPKSMKAAPLRDSVYHISPLRLWSLPIILIVIAFFMLSLTWSNGGTPQTRSMAMYIGLFFFAFAAVMYLILRRTRLVLTADGVRLHQFGYVLQTEWNNVTALNDWDGVEGLILRDPMVCPGARTLADHRYTSAYRGVKNFSDEQIELIGQHRLIPIEAFAFWLKRGLRDDLIRRAPAIERS
jgi:hypothetical protein